MMASRASQFPQGVPVVSVAYLFHICEGSWMCSICPCPLTTGKTPAALKPHQLGPRLCPDLPGARPTSGGFRNRRRPSPPMEEQQPPPPPPGSAQTKLGWIGPAGPSRNTAGEPSRGSRRNVLLADRSPRTPLAPPTPDHLPGGHGGRPGDPDGPRRGLHARRGLRDVPRAVCVATEQSFRWVCDPRCCPASI